MKGSLFAVPVNSSVCGGKTENWKLVISYRGRREGVSVGEKKLPRAEKEASLPQGPKNRLYRQ